MKYKNGKFTCSDPEEMRQFFYTGKSEFEIEGGWLPDHTDPIFDERYQVVLPAIAMESMRGLSLRGFNLTGIREVDKETPNTLIYPHITINEMTIVIENGYSPSLIHIDDALAIYRSIETYIRFWSDRAANRYQDVHNAITVPDEDISLLKQLMDSIYPLVQGQVENAPEGILGGLSRILDIVALPSVNISITNKPKEEASPYIMGAI